MKRTKSARIVISLLILFILFGVTILIAQTALGTLLTKMVQYTLKALLSI